MLKILIWGIGGRLGRTLKETIETEGDAVVVGGVDAYADATKFDVPIFENASKISVTPDVIIDFSRPDAVFDMLPYAVENGVPAVIATTGHGEEENKLIAEAAKNVAIFKASNMSLGINLLITLVKKAAATLADKFDIEIIEQHHNVKADAPSGTALTIAEAINEEFDGKKEFVYGRHDKSKRREKPELGIHAVRGGTMVGKHEVLFLGNDEIITIAHEAQSKAVFCEGALKAAAFIADLPAGLYGMSDLIK